MLQMKAPRKGRFFFALEKPLVAAGLLFFLLSWLAPNHYLPWLSFHNEAPMFAALLIFAAALLCRSSEARMPRTALVLLVLPLFLIVAQLLAEVILSAGSALVSSLFMGGVLIAWWLGASAMLAARNRDKVIICFASAIILAAALSGFLAVLQWLHLETELNIYAVERGPGTRPAANLAQPNLLATLLVMGVVSIALLRQRNCLRFWQAVVLLVFLSFALVMTESRAGLLSALCVGTFCMFRSRLLGLRGGWRVVVFWWAMLLVLWAAWGPLNEALLLQSPRELTAGVDNVRLVLWTQMLSAIAQSPWWGYGWNQTVVAQKFGVAAAPGSWSTDYAHNIALDVLTWVGLPLGLAYLGMLAWWIARCAWRIKNQTELLLFCAVLPVLVHSLVEFPFAYAFFLFPVACVLGALHAVQSPGSFRTSPPGLSWRRVLIGSALLAYALVCGRVFFEYLAAEEDMRVMRFELRRIGQTPADYEAPDLVLLNQIGGMLELGRFRPKRNMPLSDLERMRKVNLAQSWGTLHLNYVIALGLNGKPGEAGRELRVLRDLYGPQTYAQAKGVLMAMRASYPELAAVSMP